MRETCTAMEITEKADIVTKKDHCGIVRLQFISCILQPL